MRFLAPLLLCSACISPSSDPIRGMSRAQDEPSKASGAEATLTPTASGDDYVFVWLRSGSSEGLSPEEVQAASSGHFANMARLFSERFLLIAGPLGEPRADPAHRGLFVFDVDEVAEAHELTRSDPAVASGVFVFEAVPMRTSSPLRAVFELEEENEEGLDGMRSYVLAMTPRGEEADAALEILVEEGLVLLSARLGGEREGTGLYFLGTESLAEAREMISIATGGAPLDWVLSPWFGSKSLQRLQAVSGR